MKFTRSLNRRRFLRCASYSVGAGFALPSLFLNRTRAASGEDPSGFVRIGVIGTGGRGIGNMRAMIKNVVAVCDVDSTHAAAGAASVEKSTGRKPAVFSDCRKLLDDTSIDAVLVATPDHWHALPSIDACLAGKDVYCEKPLTLFIEEGKRLVRAARNAKRVVQCGSQQRSEAKFLKAAEYVRNGPQHHQNWLECIKTRNRPICDVAIGHRSATVCHLGNIAVRTGHRIHWDPVKEVIVGDAEAAKLANQEYRAPWKLTQV